MRAAGRRYTSRSGPGPSGRGSAGRSTSRAADSRTALPWPDPGMRSMSPGKSAVWLGRTRSTSRAGTVAHGPPRPGTSTSIPTAAKPGARLLRPTARGHGWRGPRGRRTRWAHARSGLERRVPGVGREESATGDEAGLREGAPVTLRVRLGLVVATVMCITTGGLLASGRSQQPFAASGLPANTWVNLRAGGVVSGNGVGDEGYSTFVYSPGLKKGLVFAKYHAFEMGGGEDQNALLAYDFGLNRWDVLEITEDAWSEHLP